MHSNDAMTTVEITMDY